MIVTVGDILNIVLGKLSSEIGTGCAERGSRRVYKEYPSSVSTGTAALP